MNTQTDRSFNVARDVLRKASRIYAEEAGELHSCGAKLTRLNTDALGEMMQPSADLIVPQPAEAARTYAHGLATITELLGTQLGETTEAYLRAEENATDQAERIMRP